MYLYKIRPEKLNKPFAFCVLAGIFYVPLAFILCVGAYFVWIESAGEFGWDWYRKNYLDFIVETS